MQGPAAGGTRRVAAHKRFGSAETLPQRQFTCPEDVKCGVRTAPAVRGKEEAYFSYHEEALLSPKSAMQPEVREKIPAETPGWW